MVRASPRAVRRPPIALLLLAVLLACAGKAGPPLVPAGTSKPLTFSILEDYDKGQDLQAIARDFELFAVLGISTWRGSFGWDDYEPEAGRYDFAWLHQFMNLAGRHGIALRPYGAYTPEWAAGGRDTDGAAGNQPPRGQRDWRIFMAAFAREIRHHPNVRSLEIYNEENVAQWWEGSRAEYAATLRSAASAIGRHERSFDLIAGGLVFPDVDWVEDICGAKGTGRAFDVLAVHAYPETWTPAGVTVENYLGASFGSTFAAAADRACGPKRIWINETGYATVPGRTERDQAAWWVRAIATFAAEPRVEHIGVYEIRDLAADRPAIGDALNYHLGLVRTDGTKKLAFHTVALLAHLFQTPSIAVVDAEAAVTRAAPGGELYLRVFRRADRTRILIAWNRTNDEEVKLSLGGSARTITEYGLDGRTIATYAGPALQIRLEAGIPRVFAIASD